MVTAIKNGFQGVVLPSPRIRTLIIPGHCHEILKRSSRLLQVTKVYGDGSAFAFGTEAYSISTKTTTVHMYEITTVNFLFNFIVLRPQI